ncbi:TM7S3 protein, partial [Amia calva]|nr:TM7S3 protein [Amia calva]
QAFPPQSSYTGTSAGLWIPLRPSDRQADFCLRASENVTALVTAVLYGEQDPVPGACNMEFRMEDDPNIHLRFTTHETVTEFAPANLGVARGQPPPSCDTGQGTHTRWRLTYELYQYFLPEGDLSEASLFDGLAKMNSVREVEQNGRKVASLTSLDKTRVLGNAYAGIGVVFCVIVRDPLLNTSSLYVPASTYSCHFSSRPPQSCQIQGQTATRVFFTVLGVCGLFVCFVGHRFLTAESFFLGFLTFGFVAFALLGRFSGQSYEMCLVYTAVLAVVGGGLCALCWWRFGAPILLTVLAGLALGLVLAAGIALSPVVNEPPLRSDLLFWVCVTGFSVLLTLLLLSWPRTLIILSGAVVGSYMAVFMLGTFLPSGLSYVLVSAVRRAVSPPFSQAIVFVPFQTRDFVLTALWAVLAVGGAVSQHFLTRDKPHFPPCPYRSRSSQTPSAPQVCDERTPLRGRGVQVCDHTGLGHSAWCCGAALPSGGD